MSISHELEGLCSSKVKNGLKATTLHYRFEEQVNQSGFTPSIAFKDVGQQLHLLTASLKELNIDS